MSFCQIFQVDVVVENVPSELDVVLVLELLQYYAQLVLIVLQLSEFFHKQLEKANLYFSGNVVGFNQGVDFLLNEVNFSAAVFLSLDLLPQFFNGQHESLS